MSKASILIVEDEAIVAADLAGMLGRLGYMISGTTPRGEESISLARERRPDLVLMDIRLTGAMDGVEAAGIIHRDLDLPVIFLTAHSDQATLERAKLSEPFGYLLKPFEELGLETHIEMALFKHSADRKLRRAHDELELRVQERTRELREAEQELREINESLERRVEERTADLQAANSKLLNSRRAALNMMEDAVAARRQADEASLELQREAIERRQAEEALRKSRERLDLALASSRMATFDWDIVMDRRTWSDGVHSLLGTKPETFSGTSEEFFQIIHPEDKSFVQAALVRALETTGVYETEYRAVWSDGNIHHISARGKVLCDDAGQAVLLTGVCWDITERKRSEEKLRAQARTLKALNSGNHALLHATDELSLLQAACKTTVEDCGHAMVWVGFAEEDEEKSVRPVASAGFEEGYLESLKISWADTERGRGPTGTAIRTGKPCGCADMLSDPAFEPWRTEAIKRGYASSLVLPLMSDGKSLGALSIYSPKPNAFSADEEALLMQLADELAYGISTVRLRVAHDQAYEELRQAKEEWERTFNSVPDLISIIDDAHRVVRVNKAMADRIGCKPGECVGMPCYEAVHGANLPPDFCPHSKTMGDGVEHNVELHEVRLGGDYLVTTTPLLDAHGRMTGSVHVARDITERKRAEEELRRAMEDAEAATRAKSQFLANMSHELRTPMTGVLGMLDVVLSGNLEAEQREFIETAKTSAFGLVSILNDILDLTKIEVGKMSIIEKPFSIRKSVEQTFNILLPFAKGKELDFSFMVADDVPETLVGDQVRVSQVLTNLAGNGVKFTENGKVEIRVTSCGCAPCGKREVTFTVSDTGIGIPDDKKGLLFNIFSQVDESHSRVFGGTGLGLSITKELVELMGGTITVTSEIGKGSSFSCTIPFGEAEYEMVTIPEPGKSAPAEKSHSADGRTKAHLLVAEDDHVIRNVLGTMLKMSFYETDFAENGHKVVEMWESGSYDLILMDVQMPKMNGFEATAAIREIERTNGGHIPIVAMTAHALKEDEERCLEAGMDAYVSKPIDFKNTLEVIRETLKNMSGIER